jgi:hypothetical protein
MDEVYEYDKINMDFFFARLKLMMLNDMLLWMRLNDINDHMVQLHICMKLMKWVILLIIMNLQHMDEVNDIYDINYIYILSWSCEYNDTVYECIAMHLHVVEFHPWMELH